MLTLTRKPIRSNDRSKAEVVIRDRFGNFVGNVVLIDCDGGKSRIGFEFADEYIIVRSDSALMEQLKPVA